MIGVFDKKWMKPFAEALKENNVVHAYIVHSDDGMDEISPFAKTNVVELKDGKINEFTINPKDLGINENNKENLKGKNAEIELPRDVFISKVFLLNFGMPPKSIRGHVETGSVGPFGLIYELSSGPS